jgi:hypothetical protein
VTAAVQASRTRRRILAHVSGGRTAGSLLIRTPADAAALLPALDDTFDSAELAAGSGIDRRVAQRMAYCLRSPVHAGE